MKKLTAIFLSFILILIFLVVYSNNDQKQHIYVSMEGNDEQAGSLKSPLRTLKQAAAVAKAGTTVHVREGIYAEKLIVQHSGTKSEPIVFKPYQDEEVVLSGAGLESEEGDTALITIDDKNHVEISGFIVQDLSTDLRNETVMGILVTGSSSHLLLDNNTVRNIETQSPEGNAHGIAVYGTGPMKNITLTNNTVEDLKLGASEALVLNGNIDGFEIADNIVRRCNNIGIDLIGYEGVSADDKYDYVRNGVVSGNKVYEISSYGNPAYGNEYNAGGIYVDGGRDIQIEKNTVYQNDIGIEATSEHAGKWAERIEIVKNTVYDNFYTGIAIGGYDEERGGTINSQISKNSLERNDTKGLGGGQILIQHAAEDNVIEKNILTIGPSAIFIANYEGTGKNNEFHQNTYHSETEDKGIWVWQDEEFTSLAAFQEAARSEP